MNTLDFILLVVVGWSIVTGVMTGFTRMAIGFAATMLGILFGFWFYYVPGGWFQQYFHSETASNVIGFFLVFTVFVIAGAIAGRVLSKMLKIVGLSPFDRVCGAAFGFVRGTVLAVAVVTVITAFAPNPPPRFIVESKMMPYATTAGSVLAWLAPRTMTEGYRATLDKLQGIWSAGRKRVAESRKETI